MLNQKITTVVVSKDRTELKKMVLKLNGFDVFSIVGQASNLSQAVFLVTNFIPELVFVCVDLDIGSGLEVVRALRARNIFSEFIFVSDNADLAYESLQLEPMDYLIKPIDSALIQEMLVRLKMKLKKKELFRKMDVFAKANEVVIKRVFKHKRGIIILFLEEIVFCKAELTAAVLTLKSGEIVRLKGGINETLETINSENFIRIGRSYGINRNYLRKIDKRNCKCRLSFNGKEWEIPISKNSIVQLEKFNFFPI